METKVCSKCKEEKDLGEFTKCSRRKDGRNYSCKKCKNTMGAKYYIKNKEKIKEYFTKNKERIKNYKKQHYKKNKKHIIEKCVEYTKNRRKKDSLYKLKHDLGNLILGVLKTKGYAKKSKTYLLLEADFETVKNHLEYTWFQNYGTEYIGQKVHIDHITPCASAKTEEELSKLQHYTNLQYLTPEDNLRKSDKLNWGI